MANTAFESITTRSAWYANENLSKYDAAMLDTDGKIAKADGTGAFIGIVEYGALSGNIATVVRGIFPGVLSENAVAGARLTIDANNAGKFKIAGANDKTYGTLLANAAAGDLASIYMVETGAVGFDTTVNTVTFALTSDVAGDYVTGTTTIALASETTGATIYYRWGTTGQWVEYSTAIATTGKTGAQTLQAYAAKTGMADAAITELALDQAVAATPVFNPLTGAEYTAGTTTVALTAANCTIKYKLSTDEEYTTYSEAIATTLWTGEVTVQAYATRTGYADSPVVSATFTAAA